ncbi:MAG TPA: hypothetical protein VF705_12000 [Longimicrobium sp.]|jgi:hypothetical protein
MDPLTGFMIDYAEAIGTAGPEDLAALIEYLFDELPYRWIDSYREMSSHEPEILEVPDRGFTFLFDLTAGRYPQDDPASPHDRVVAAYGISKAPEAKRDASRLRGFGISEGCPAAVWTRAT